MKYPKLKNALFCRILVYVVVVGGFIVPPLILCAIEQIPDAVGIIAFIACTVGLLVYIVRNYLLLMTIDVMLAGIHCMNTARKLFFLPETCNFDRMEKRLSSFGTGYESLRTAICPTALRYRFRKSMTVYSKGTEEVVGVYRVVCLDRDTYRGIFGSALAQSKSLIGKKKPLFVEKAQAKSPLKRVTVIVIFASRVDGDFKEKLYKTVCDNDGDGTDTAVVPCVICEQDRTCVFNCERLPYFGYSYPVKNRGIRIIRKRVFGGRLPLEDNTYTVVELPKETDMDMSLWSLFRKLRKELILNEREEKKRFESMTHGQIASEDDLLYVKWEEHGLVLATERDDDAKTVKVDSFQSWTYPKANKISKKAVAGIRELIISYMTGRGYSAEFLTFDD